ncbi:DNA-directed RNA polymerase subunit K [candidate division KSB1 bacterium]
MEKPIKYTKYEIARMLGSRALQISMGAPFLVKLDEKDLVKLKYDPLEIAKLEFSKNVLPITVRRPLPKVHESQTEAS